MSSKIGAYVDFIGTDKVTSVHSKIISNIAKGNDRLEKASSSKFDKMLSSAKAPMSKYASNIKMIGAELTSQIPMLESLGPALSNPYTAAAVAAGAFIAIGVSATNKAADFQEQFNKLNLLNADKSSGEIKKLSDDIIMAGAKTGLSLSQLSTGVFDYQSLTNKYGEVAISNVVKLGKFAHATGADVNETVAAGAKAIKVFKGLSEESFMASNFATFNVAKVDMNELSKVQGAYIGATAGAGQMLDSGNKVFALLSSISKNAEEASTKTKGFMEGLTTGQLKQNLDAFNKYTQTPIKLYDDRGNMRQADIILREMVTNFSKLSDSQMNSLIDQIGGNEGLRDVLMQTKANGVEVLTVLDNYDKYARNFDPSKLDGMIPFNTKKLEFWNKFESLMTKLGMELLPVANKALDYLSVVMDKATTPGTILNKTLSFMLTHIKFGIGLTEKLGSVFDKIFNNKYVAIYTNQIEKLAHLLYDTYLFLQSMVYLDFDNMKSVGENIAKDIMSFGTTASLDEINAPISKFEKRNTTTSRERSKAIGSKAQAGFNNPEDAYRPISNNTSVSGGTSSARSVTINIQKLVEKIEINAMTVKESATEVTRIVEEALIRALNDYEASL